MTCSLRICSYNIHKGFNSGNSKFLLEEIRHAIRLVNADMVFLQEVVGENQLHEQHWDNWRAETQFEFLADEVWHHQAYGKNAIYDHGHHGNAILSKAMFTDWDNHDMTVLAPVSQRGILHGVVETGLHVICLHMGLLGVERRLQRSQLCKLVTEKIPDTAPLLIAGDFNDWRSSTHRMLKKNLGLKEALEEQHGKPARTWPARLPLLPMDRIYYRNMELVDAECMTGHPWSELSDHCALYAEFRY